MAEHQRKPGESVSGERERLKNTMASRGGSHPGTKPFHAETFDGKVKNLLAQRNFHPGMEPEKRKKLARGRVAQTLRARGEPR